MGSRQPRNGSIEELVLAELRAHRVRLARLLRLVEAEMRREGDAAFSTVRRAKPAGRVTRSQQAA
jgi:hypothetical protein